MIIKKEKYTLEVFAESKTAPLCLLLSDEDGGCGVWEAIPSPRPSLISVTGFDWNRELSPWSAPRAFKGGSDFGGMADSFLSSLLPLALEAEKEAGLYPSKRIIAGYSLAGLTAVYALYKTDIFSAAVSASGSMWFDGFTDYMDKGSPKGEPEFVYFSLGDREDAAKNPRLAAVKRETERACAIIKGKGISSVFELNPGNHFANPTQRTAKGIETAIKNLRP